MLCIIAFIFIISLIPSGWILAAYTHYKIEKGHPFPFGPKRSLLEYILLRQYNLRNDHEVKW